MLSYQIEEFEALSFVEGELATLEIEHKRLSQAQSILAELAQVRASMENLDDLRQASKILEGIDDNHSALDAGMRDPKFGNSPDRRYEQDLRHYSEQVIVDPQTLQTQRRGLSRFTTLHANTECSRNG